VFGSVKVGANHSALKDKYETAEQALQRKWYKYCSRGELLFSDNYTGVFRIST